MFVARRPDAAQLEAVLAKVRATPLTYAPVGLARCPEPEGFRVAEERVVIGHGEDAYARGLRGLREWRHFELGWVTIYPRQPALEVGTPVLILARHLGFWSINACRVVEVTSALAAAGPPRSVPETSANVAAFAYGTVAEHAESGEEIFEVALDPVTAVVTYRVRAVSRERSVLARLGFPIARAFQARFRRDSAEAMRRYVADSAP